MKKLLYSIIFLVVFYGFQPTYTQCEECKSIKPVQIKSEKTFNNIYHEKFKDLLLVIHFNYPYYDNIQFLKNLYSPIFKNIVFYGEKPDPNVFNIHTSYGHYLSGVIQDILTRFPQYKGYLILQDDCILNFWNFIHLDQNKIWFSVVHDIPWLISHFGNMSYFTVNSGSNDMLIAQVNNANNIPKWWREVREDGLTTYEQTRRGYYNLTPNDIDILQKNIGKNNIAANACDLWYFPSRLSESIMRLSQIFKNVWCESAIPTMLCCIEPIQNWERLKMKLGPWELQNGVSSLTITNYPMGTHWLHPVKFSNLNNRGTFTDIFNKMLQIKN